MYDNIEYKSFIALLVLVTLGFAGLLFPFFGIIFWSIAITILFAQLQDFLVKKLANKNMAALMTLLICIVIIVLPFLFIANAFLEQGFTVYQGVKNGSISFNQYFDKIKASFPILQDALEKLNINPENLREKLTQVIVFITTYIGQQAVSIGTKTINIIAELGMLLYITFFTLRDKNELIIWLHRALPLGDRREAMLFEKIAEVTKATINGSLVVAIVQGFLGGCIFWYLDVQAPILWGVVMTVLSLVPIVGAALVWLPVAIYFFATGNITSGIILSVFGAGVIGLVDNILRPLLVGRDTRLPDYLVLLSTLGGFTLFGMNGFIIGPLITVLFITCWDIFIREYNVEEDKHLSAHEHDYPEKNAQRPPITDSTDL